MRIHEVLYWVSASEREHCPCSLKTDRFLVGTAKISHAVGCVRCHGQTRGSLAANEVGLVPAFFVFTDGIFSQTEFLAVDSRRGLHRSAVEVMQ